MITPSPAQRRRPPRLPRSLSRGGRPIPEPISSAHAGFFGGAGFYLRVGILAAVALTAFGILALRLWSLQVLQGPRYSHLAQRQTFRYVDLPAPRAPIVDAKGKTLAGTTGRLVLTADAESLGRDVGRGRWVPTPHGRRLLQRVARLGDTNLPTLLERVRRSRIRSPWAPAVVLPHLTRALTIDARLQRAAEHAIRDGIAAAQKNGHADARNGAAVVMNAHTGGLLALASWPSFNQVAAADSPDYLARLLNPKSSLPGVFNLATEGLYPTGSTFKPIVAEAALSAGLITPYSGIPCTGTYTVGGHVFSNVESNVNAVMSLPEALTVSCDTWFYRVGSMFYRRQATTGQTDMQNWARMLGLGHTTGLDIPGEAGGGRPAPPRPE